jgi:nitrite reductase/ring-hydroxylating ferredoxin subunit
MHGSQFDLQTGKVVRWIGNPGFMGMMGKLMSSLGLAAKKEKPLTIYEVKIEGNKILAKII